MRQVSQSKIAFQRRKLAFQSQVDCHRSLFEFWLKNLDEHAPVGQMRPKGPMGSGSCHGLGGKRDPISSKRVSRGAVSVFPVTVAYESSWQSKRDSDQMRRSVSMQSTTTFSDHPENVQDPYE